MIEALLSKCCQENNFIITGDFNVNMMSNKNVLSEILDVHGVKNMVSKPTCFKSEISTLIDLVITNVPKRLQNVSCIDVGLSDFHSMVCFSTKMHIPIKRKQSIIYHSYKHFNNDKYVKELDMAPSTFVKYLNV